MKKIPVRPGDGTKRAVVDTVRSILAHKGSDVASIAPIATVYQAILQMAMRGVGALPVVLEGKLIGIVSERDYARKVIILGRSSNETLVSDIMTPSPHTVTPDHTVDECLRIVTDHHIRHLPVIEEGELVGIVSIGDLVKAIISSQAYTIDQLHSYIGAGYPT